MKYYKVPEHFDGKQIYTQKKDYFTLVANELITEKECKKVGIENFAKRHFTLVNVKKTNIYFFLGARFEITNN